MITLNRFSETIDEIMAADDERDLWELYLACVANPYREVTTFNDFKDRCCKPIAETEVDLEATVKNTFDILNNFTP